MFDHDALQVMGKVISFKDAFLKKCRGDPAFFISFISKTEIKFPWQKDLINKIFKNWKEKNKS